MKEYEVIVMGSTPHHAVRKTTIEIVANFKRFFNFPNDLKKCGR